MWKLVGLNYYGGKIYKTEDGYGKAIQCFNYYYQPNGFELWLGGEYMGKISNIGEAP